MKLFGSTKQLIDKTKNGENISSLCNLVDKSISRKIWSIISNVEPSNLVFLKTYNIELDGIVINFTDENGRLLEIEDKVNLTLLINKEKCDDTL